jgi:hypothetical protein
MSDANQFFIHLNTVTPSAADVYITVIFCAIRDLPLVSPSTAAPNFKPWTNFTQSIHTPFTHAYAIHECMNISYGTVRALLLFSWSWVRSSAPDDYSCNESFVSIVDKITVIVIVTLSLSLALALCYHLWAVCNRFRINFIQNYTLNDQSKRTQRFCSSSQIKLIKKKKKTLPETMKYVGLTYFKNVV